MEALGDNAYRFDLIGSNPLTGNNGKIFDVPVAISAEAEPEESYAVVLTNGAIINLDESKEVISVRNGYIYVEAMKEDGLYAQFNYEKLQGRVKFTNMSADKAISYLWDFGDGATSTEQHPLHTYAQPGYYDVTLTVKGQTGTDVALMTVLINDVSTWQVDGTFFLDDEELSVRHFTSAMQLLAFITDTPIVGNLTLNIKDGTTFDCSLDETAVSQLRSLQEALAERALTLTLKPAGDGGDGTALAFGQTGASVDTEVVSLFVELGASMVIEQGATLLLWGIGFDPSQMKALAVQTVLSAQPTEAVTLSLISTDLTYQWTVASAPESSTGYTAEGTGDIPSMTITSGSATECSVVYHIVATWQGAEFMQFTHTITLKPALEGSFTELLPADGSAQETTTVTLSWNSIGNAVYDVYLWNAANQRPAMPVAEGISENSYVSRNFCQDQHDYRWQVVARNEVQQMASEEQGFSIRFLPDLHVRAIATDHEPEAGRRVTISWTVRNDGAGTTGSQAWSDRVWLVPDVYSGTAQPSAKLLATMPNLKALASGEEYTASAEVLLDEQSYGSYYLLAAADMSAVTLIDWESVGGSIVNPYQPTLDGEGTSYAYLFATTPASGNQLKEHGETETRSDNFFYQKVEIAMPTMDEEDWNILQTAYEQMGSGEGWTRPWNFDVERRTVQTLPGVTILEGRVVNIDLSSNNLTGDFPFGLLNLGRLRSLDLSDNQLEGSIGEGMAACVVENATAGNSIETIDISNNQLEGNIGQFAQPLTTLTTLLAEGNRLAGVEPMISTSVKTLTLGNQTLSTIVAMDVKQRSSDVLRQQLPQTLRYDHRQQNYDKPICLLCSTDYDDWSMAVDFGGDELLLTNGSTAQNDFRGESGDVVNVAVADANKSPDGSTLKMRLTFGQGDANFSGSVDVVDLQAQINFAFEDYNDKPFNFTAANLWTDEVINVQDVVRMVDLLLQKQDDDAADGVRQSMSMLRQQEGRQQPQAMVYVDNGKLWIDARQPVAAIELDVECVDGSLTPIPLPGFNIRTSSRQGVTRLVAYSLTGARLSEGLTPVCELQQSGCTVVKAVLADAGAEPMSVMTGSQTTAIREIDNSQLTIDNCFDLQGRRVTTPRRGLYVKNGRKIVYSKNSNNK